MPKSGTKYQADRGDRPGHQRGREHGSEPRWRAVAHHDVGVAALLEVRIEEVLRPVHWLSLDTLENQLFSINPPDEMLY
jgi:hypothetical protein